VFDFKLAKSALMIKKILKSNMRIKNAEISNILEGSKNLDFDFFINRSSKNLKKPSARYTKSTDLIC
jgi:hypothetical protein